MDDTLYIGADPGLTSPCICVLDGKTQEPLGHRFMNGARYKDWDNYSRAFVIGLEMAEFVKKNFGTKVVLAIEGPSYGSKQQSSSMEQMAYCRQALHDAFKITCQLVACYTIAPTTAKKALTGDGRADKEKVMYYAKVLAPKMMQGKEPLRTVHKRDGGEEQQINMETSAIADSYAIAVAGRKKHGH